MLRAREARYTTSAVTTASNSDQRYLYAYTSPPQTPRTHLNHRPRLPQRLALLMIPRNPPIIPSTISLLHPRPQLPTIHLPSRRRIPGHLRRRWCMIARCIRIRRLLLAVPLATRLRPTPTHRFHPHTLRSTHAHALPSPSTTVKAIQNLHEQRAHRTYRPGDDIRHIQRVKYSAERGRSSRGAAVEGGLLCALGVVGGGERPLH